MEFVTERTSKILRDGGNETEVEFVTEINKMRDGGNETKVEFVTERKKQRDEAMRLRWCSSQKERN